MDSYLLAKTKIAGELACPSAKGLGTLRAIDVGKAYDEGRFGTVIDDLNAVTVLDADDTGGWKGWLRVPAGGGGEQEDQEGSKVTHGEAGRFIF